MANMAKCNNKDCFAHWEGNCRCLSNNDFKGKPCPFFADKREVSWEELDLQCRGYTASHGGKSL